MTDYTLEQAMAELTRRFKERPDETTGDSPHFTQPAYFRELAESAGVDVNDGSYTTAEVDRIEQAERDNNADIQREIDDGERMTAETPDDQRIYVNDTIDRVARDFLDAHDGRDPYESLREANRPHAFAAMAELGIKYWAELIPGEITKPGSEWTLPDGAERLYKYLLAKVMADHDHGGS